MCGRYAASQSPEDLVEEFEIERVDVRGVFEPDFNVAPTKDVPVVVERHPPGERDAAPERRLITARWGLVPWWAKDAKIGNKMINARMETVADKPAYRKAFASRRALLPADGYYEWYATSRTGKSGKPVKQPFFIRPRDGGVLAMAGLYEIWRDKEVPEDHRDAFVWTTTVITTRAADDLGHLHDRMPLLVERERRAAWLDPARSDPEELLALLVPAAAGLLEAYPVSTAVNDVRNAGAELVQPIDLEPVDG
ncbi:MAG: SOS response-associated peptidase [Nocardioidaceae bacterium]